MCEYADIVSGFTAKSAAVPEIAPGPGYLAIELARRGFKVTGVTVDFKQGNASALPFPDGWFDFIICSAT